MIIQFVCKENHAAKRNVVDAAGTIQTEEKHAKRADGSLMPYQQPVQEKWAELVRLFIASDANKANSDTVINLILADPAQWGHFVEGKIYEVDFK